MYKEQDITGIKTHELLELGISYVPQGRINFSSLTIQENLLIGAEHLKEKELVEKALKNVYKRYPVLKEKERELAYSLSGGQQQMLAIGRALMQNPQVLLMDEPSLGLSPKLIKESFRIIEQLRKEGMTLIIVEQNAKKAIEIADHTYLLEDGKVALKGDKAIIKNPKIQEVYLGGRY